jgi:hypothetical protein
MSPTLAAPAPRATGQATESVDAFAPDSPWRTPIPRDAAVDPAGATMIAWATREDAAYANLVEFGIPIYFADATTPRYRIPCDMTWDRCPFDGLAVPVPHGARPHSGSDGAMVVIDTVTRQVFEFWRMRRATEGWATGFGAVNDLDGSGWGGNSTGSGASRLAGVVLISEMERGVIPHALAIQTDNVCAAVYRAPALKTDGVSRRPDCIPEGTRVRLDPETNLDAFEMTPAERVIATALQTYGGYVMDRSRAAISISFERDRSADDDRIGQVWTRFGLRWDYDALPGIPWHRLQVLTDRSASPATVPVGRTGGA